MIINLYKQIFSEVSSRVILSTINQITMIITIIFLSTKLDLNTLGMISYILILNQIFLTVSNLGFGDQTHELLAGEKKTYTALLNLIKNIFIWKIIVFFIFVILILFLIFSKSLPINNLNYILIIFFLNFLTIFNFNFVILALKKVGDILIYIFIVKFIFLINVILVIKNNNHIIYFCFLFCIAQMFTTIIEINAIKNTLIKSIKRKTALIIFKNFLKNAYSYFLTHFINNRFILIWSPVVIGKLGLAQIAIFGIIEQIIRSTSHLTAIISQVFQINKKSKEISKIFIFYFAILLSLTILVFINLEFMVSYFFDGKFKIFINEFKFTLIILYLSAFIKTYFYNFYYNKKISNKITYLTFALHMFGLIIWYLNFNNTLNILGIILIILILQFLFILFDKRNK